MIDCVSNVLRPESSILVSLNRVKSNLSPDGGFLIAGGEPTMGNEKVAMETEIECLYEDSTLKFE